MTQLISPPFHPRGNAKKWDRGDWLLLLGLTDDDADSAQGMWEQHVPPKYRGVIDGDGWEFDTHTQQYIRRNGTAMADDDLKWITLLYVGSIEAELQDQAEAMARGDVDIEEWQETAATTIKDLYLSIAAVAGGGFNLLEPEDRADIIGSPTEGRTLVGDVGIGSGYPPGGLADAMTRLQAFAEQVEAGQVVSPSKVLWRAGLYAGPANVVFEEVKRNSHVRARDDEGQLLFTQERNILAPEAQHCRSTEFTDGCPEVTQAGWQPIDTLPVPGLRSCHGACKCRMEFRQHSPEDQN